MKLSSAIVCYELMDQAGLLRLKQAFESDLINNINTEEGVVFASMREQIIDSILEEQEEKETKKTTHRFVIDLLKKEREGTERRLKYQYSYPLQTKDAIKKLKEQVVEINRAIFVLLKDARK